MPGLLNLTLAVPNADLAQVTQDLHPIFSAQAAWLAKKFPNGAVFVREALANVPRLAQFAEVATEENADRAREQSEQTILQTKIRTHVSTARRRAQRVCKALKSTDFPTARSLAACIGINSRLSLTRNSEVNQLLLKTAAAHNEFRDLLKTWGSSDEFLDQAQILADALGPQSAELRKEQAEAETATTALESLLALVVQQTNALIEAVEEFAPDENPELFQKTESVLNKYSHVLVPRSDNNDAAATSSDVDAPDADPQDAT